MEASTGHYLHRSFCKTADINSTAGLTVTPHCKSPMS